MRSASRPIIRHAAGGAPSPADDLLAVEEPLEIRVRGRAVSITMRTPGHDDELAVGFLLSEGVVRCAGDVLSVEPCGRNEHGNLLNVQLRPEVHVDFERLTRHVFAGSSCGLCGRATIESLRTSFGPITHPVLPAARVLLSLPGKMRSAQAGFDDTGGVHAAALFSIDGDLLAVREDVGRHNAVDKLIGQAALRGRLPLDRHVLLVSGRASFEIMQKALAGRIAVVAAVSAPTTLAVDFAASNGQTLVGFLRDGRFNCYAGHLAGK